jgi:hypothetical protein
VVFVRMSAGNGRISKISPCAYANNTVASITELLGQPQASSYVAQHCRSWREKDGSSGIVHAFFTDSGWCCRRLLPEFNLYISSLCEFFSGVKAPGDDPSHTPYQSVSKMIRSAYAWRCILVGCPSTSTGWAGSNISSGKYSAIRYCSISQVLRHVTES